MNVDRVLDFSERYKFLFERQAELSADLRELDLQAKANGHMTNLEIAALKKWVKADMKDATDKVNEQHEAMDTIGRALRALNDSNLTETDERPLDSYPEGTWIPDHDPETGEVIESPSQGGAGEGSNGLDVVRPAEGAPVASPTESEPPALAVGEGPQTEASPPVALSAGDPSQTGLSSISPEPVAPRDSEPDVLPPGVRLEAGPLPDDTFHIPPNLDRRHEVRT